MPYCSRSDYVIVAFKDFVQNKLGELDCLKSFELSLSSTAATEPAKEEPVDETGVDPIYVDLVLQQAKVSRSAAVKALRETKGDIVEAILVTRDPTKNHSNLPLKFSRRKTMNKKYKLRSSFKYSTEVNSHSIYPFCSIDSAFSRLPKENRSA
jgi:hypothetical protein